MVRDNHLAPGLHAVVAALSLGALGLGCVAGVPDELELTAAPGRQAIVGGDLENGFPLVGALAIEYPGWGIEAFCTATAVTPTVLITAAHCLDAFDDMAGYQVIFHQTLPGGRTVSTNVDRSSRTNHPDWGWYFPGMLADIGVVGLREPLPDDRYPRLRSTRIGHDDVGLELMVVGFGVTTADGADSGQKRSITMELGITRDEYFEIIIDRPDDWRGVCYGDSGGPTFLLGEARHVQLGVHARTSSEECGPGEDTSVGYYYEGFLWDAIVALDPEAASCGDGLCTGLEDEPDCPADCSGGVCGDGIVHSVEACDDGNTVDGDGCSASCLSDETCGNAIVDRLQGEACDDGNVLSGDGCSADCGSDERCGNGIVDSLLGETCDDGNTISGDYCSADCRSDESCGNGFLDMSLGEVCDDGNRSGGDGCSADCLSNESCGNGSVDQAAGETCDDGNWTAGDGCSSTCRLEDSCGNGILERDLLEICDDGNRADGDGCAGDCRSDERCGNGVLDLVGGEVCDDGNTVSGDGCPSDCGLTRALSGCRAAGAGPRSSSWPRLLFSGRW